MTAPTILVDTNNNPLPLGGTIVQGKSGVVGNATAVGTLAGASGKTTYITGWQAQATGSTSVSVGNVTVTDGTWSQVHTFVFPAGVTTLGTPLAVVYQPPIPATAQNTSITVTLSSGGTGNTNATVNAQGFQL